MTSCHTAFRCSSRCWGMARCIFGIQNYPDLPLTLETAMTDRILLKPTRNDIDQWIKRFVPELMLWWWDDSPIPDENLAVRVLRRSESRDDPVVRDIVTVNAFHTWAMSENVTRIIIDDGSWIASRSEEELRRASELQVRYRRGLCIPHQRLGNDAVLPDAAIVDGTVVLNQHLWASLPEVAKRAVIETELSEWDRDTAWPVPEHALAHIADISNTFVQQEGVNCLSVTAFAVTSNRDDLLQWMLPEAFLDVLRNYGYTKIGESSAQSGDVIVFRDEKGTIVHAAFAVEADRILNKNGQTSFNPVAIVDLATLREDWPNYSWELLRQAVANPAML